MPCMPGGDVDRIEATIAAFTCMRARMLLCTGVGVGTRTGMRSARGTCHWKHISYGNILVMATN